MTAPLTPEQEPRYVAMCEPCIAGEGSECHTPECAFFLHDVPRDGCNEVFAVTRAELCRSMADEVADDGLANTCRHDSATGVDTAPVGPGKVWRCDHCGLCWRQDADPRTVPLTRRRP